MKQHFMMNVGIDHGLLFEFFLTFARFEFALKAAGFFARDLERAAPDWTRFAQSLDLEAARLDPRCAEAIEYFALHPPWRQVVTANGLAWDSSVSFGRLERMDQLLKLVRRARNNLFHGGKFNDDVHSGPGRNEHLLRHSLAILHRCLELSGAVEAEYAAASL